MPEETASSKRRARYCEATAGLEPSSAASASVITSWGFRISLPGATGTCLSTCSTAYS